MAQAALMTVPAINPDLLPFLALSQALPTITTSHDADEDGDQYATLRHCFGDSSAVLMLSTAPDGLVLIDTWTMEAIGGPYANGEEAAAEARRLLTTPLD